MMHPLQNLQGVARLLILCSASLLWPSAGRARALKLPNKPSPTTLLAGAPILPNGTLIRDGERLRTLELDELAPLRVRLNIPF